MIYLANRDLTSVLITVDALKHLVKNINCVINQNTSYINVTFLCFSLCFGEKT